MARVILNKISIGKKIGVALKQPRFEGLARNAAGFRVQVAKIESLKQFDEHVVTRELRDGSKAENSVLGYGNLAAFLGLSDSNLSVSEVRTYLERGLDKSNSLIAKPKFIQNNKNVVYEFKVKSPSLREIYDRFPPPPDSYRRSWIKIIEEGIGNFAYFVFRLAGFPKSRSGTGLQRETKREWIEVPNSSPKIDWIKEVLEKFRSYFKK